MSPQNTDIPNDAASAAIEDKALDKESVIDILSEEDEKEPAVELEETEPKSEEGDKKKVKEGRKEEDIDLDEEEVEVKDEEEPLELINPPTRKEILTKYPTLFKDFPQLEKSFYREQKYAEILPTLEDAKQAAEKAQALDQFEQEIMTGSTESVLAAVRDNDKEAFAKVVDNYLPTLYKVDQHSYYHTIGNVIKHTIISMVRDSKELSNEDLGTAASILNQYIFGTDKFTHPQRLSKADISDEAQQKANEISEREKKFVEKQFTVARDDVGTRIDNIIKSSIDKAIDPNESMSDYVKKNATREVLEGLETSIMKDTRFRSIYDKLWERAAEHDFDKESMDRIKSAYLSKAKTLLPTLIQKSRQEALKGSPRHTSNDKDKKGLLPVGKTRGSASLASGKANNSGASKIPRGMSTLEFLNSDD